MQYVYICTTNLTNSVPHINNFLNCNSTQVIYMIKGKLCNLQYIGCTTRKLKVRVREHICGAQMGQSFSRNISNISRHFRETHHGYITHPEVVGMEKVTPPPRGGDWQKKNSMREAFWILKLKTHFPLGLKLRSDLTYVYWEYMRVFQIFSIIAFVPSTFIHFIPFFA